MLLFEEVKGVHRSVFVHVQQEYQPISLPTVARPVQDQLVAELTLEGGGEEGGADGEVLSRQEGDRVR